MNCCNDYGVCTQGANCPAREQTTEQQLVKLLRSYNPDLPMGAGMKATFLELRAALEKSGQAAG